METFGTFDEAGYEFDHYIEYSISRDNNIRNMMALCPQCHRVKSNRFHSKLKKQKIEPELKKENKKLKNEMNNLYEEIDDLYEEIDDLYKKNENQRKELASLNNKFRQ